MKSNTHPTRWNEFCKENSRLTREAFAADRAGDKLALARLTIAIENRTVIFQAETKRLKAAGLPY